MILLNVDLPSKLTQLSLIWLIIVESLSSLKYVFAKKIGFVVIKSVEPLLDDLTSSVLMDLRVFPLRLLPVFDPKGECFS